MLKKSEAKIAKKNVHNVYKNNALSGQTLPIQIFSTILSEKL